MENIQMNSIPKWLIDLDNNLQNEVSSLEKIFKYDKDICVGFIKESLNKNFFTKNDLDFKDYEVKVFNTFLLIIEQSRHRETRSISKRVNAYTGQIDGLGGDLENLWDKKIELIKYKPSTVGWTSRSLKIVSL